MDFELIGSSVGARRREPDLSVALGTLRPNSTAVVRWWMTSSLSGTFRNFSAAFSNANPLGDERLSLLDELEIHELVRNVKLFGGDGGDADDGVLDFLVNDVMDAEGEPEAVYDSRDLTRADVGFGSFDEGRSVEAQVMPVCADSAQQGCEV